MSDENKSYKKEYEERMLKEQREEEASPIKLSKIGNCHIIALQEVGYYLEVELSDTWNFIIKHHTNPTARLRTYRIRLDRIQKLKSSQLAKPIRDAYRALFYEKADAYLTKTLVLVEENASLFEVDAPDDEVRPKGKPSKADRLIKLATDSGIVLFKDQFNLPHVVIPVKSGASGASEAICVRYGLSYIMHIGSNIHHNPIHKENSFTSFTSSTDLPVVRQTWPVSSRYFKQWLAGLMYREDDRAPSKDALGSAITVLSAKANEGNIIDLRNRVASDGNGGIFLDRTNEAWDAIHITKNGWTIETPPVIFRRYPHQLPICNPSREGTILPLFKYINIGNPDPVRHVDEQLLYLIAFITAYIPDIPNLGTIVHGSAGHIKTMTQVLTRKLIDPSSVEYNALPSKGKLTSLIQTLTQHYYSVWDNMSDVDPETSDIFCRAITGAAFQLRALYTDDETFLRAFKRVVNMNGINIPADRPDLLDRVAVFEAPYVPMAKRRSETEIHAEFDEDLPIILGGILDILVKAIEIYPTIKLKQLPRMADFAIWGAAVSEAMGIPHSKFINAYYTNILSVKGDVVKSRITGRLLLDILEKAVPRPTKEKPDPKIKSRSYLMIELHRLIMSEAKLNSIDQRELPPDPTRLSRELNVIASNLPSLGIIMTKKSTNRGTVVTFARTRQSTLEHIAERRESYKNTWEVQDLSELFAVGSEPTPEPTLEPEPEPIPDPEPEPTADIKHVDVPVSVKSQKDNVFKIMITHLEPIKETVIQEKTGHASVELRKLLGVLKNDGLIEQIKPGVWIVTEVGS